MNSANQRLNINASGTAGGDGAGLGIGPRVKDQIGVWPRASGVRPEDAQADTLDVIEGDMIDVGHFLRRAVVNSVHRSAIELRSVEHQILHADASAAWTVVRERADAGGAGRARKWTWSWKIAPGLGGSKGPDFKHSRAAAIAVPAR